MGEAGPESCRHQTHSVVGTKIVGGHPTVDGGSHGRIAYGHVRAIVRLGLHSPPKIFRLSSRISVARWYRSRITSDPTQGKLTNTPSSLGEYLALERDLHIGSEPDSMPSAPSRHSNDHGSSPVTQCPPLFFRMPTSASGRSGMYHHA